MEERQTTPEIMYSSVVGAISICYFLVWKHIGGLYMGFNDIYNKCMPDANLYYPLLAIVGIMYLFASGTLLVGLVIKIGKILGDILL